ncbi:hypothetical protein ABKN59_004020 [Abortiporus biennis]
MLNRSKAAPLNVTIEITTKTGSIRAFKMVAGEFHRIQYLNVIIPSGSFAAIAKLFKQKDATRLLKSMTLRYQCTRTSSTGQASMESNNLLFPSCSIPRLEELMVHNFHPDTIMPFLNRTVRSFRYMPMSTWRRSRDASPSIGTVLGAITKMPLLKLLSICDLDDRVLSSTPKSHTQHISLDDLESLDLNRIDCDHAVYLLNAIRFPTTTKLYLELPRCTSRQSDDLPPTNFSTLATILSERLVGTEENSRRFGFVRLCYRQLSVVIRNLATLQMAIWADDPTYSSRADLHLSLPLTGFNIEVFCQNFAPLTYIHTLEVGCVANEWIDWLPNLPNLKNFIIADTSEYKAITLLSAAFTSGNLHVLDSLILRKVQFAVDAISEDKLKGLGEIMVDKESECFRENLILAAHLSKRLEMGGIIHKLVINNCRFVRKETVEKLGLFVDGDVEWDGHD